MAGTTSKKRRTRSRKEVGKGRKKAAAKRACEADPPRGRQPSDREGRRRRPRAGLHRGHAGLEKRRRAPPRRAHRAHRPRRAQGGEVELALLRSRGPGLVPQLPLLHEVRQGDFLPRHVAASCPPRRVQAQGGALPRHPRGRPARRGAVGDVDPAGGRPARLGPVAPVRLSARLRMPQTLVSKHLRLRRSAGRMGYRCTTASRTVTSCPFSENRGLPVSRILTRSPKGRLSNSAPESSRGIPFAPVKTTRSYRPPRPAATGLLKMLSSVLQVRCVSRV